MSEANDTWAARVLALVNVVKAATRQAGELAAERPPGADALAVLDGLAVDQDGASPLKAAVDQWRDRAVLDLAELGRALGRCLERASDAVGREAAALPTVVAMPPGSRHVILQPPVGGRKLAALPYDELADDALLRTVIPEVDAYLFAGKRVVILGPVREDVLTGLAVPRGWYPLALVERLTRAAEAARRADADDAERRRTAHAEPQLSPTERRIQALEAEVARLKAAGA